MNGETAIDHRPSGDDVLRFLAAGGGVIVFAVGLGYALNQSWATATWPWADGHLSHLFLGSILVALSAAAIWAGVVGELGVIFSAGALTVLVMTSGWAAFLFVRSSSRSGVLGFAAWSTAIAATSALALVSGCHRQIRDTRPIPRFLRISFVLFTAILVGSGVMLILRLDVFPWALNPDSSVMFGCIFIGDACFFAAALTTRRWHGARGPLLSFLAYDLVLMPRFFTLLGQLHDGRLLRMGVYLTVLVFSSVVALYYLFLARTTRSWAVR